MDENENRKRNWPWIKILLGVSLALNFAVVGVMAGVMLRHGGGFDRSNRSPEISAFGAPFIRALSRQDRRSIARAIRESRKGDLPTREMRRKMFEDVLVTLRSVPFDPRSLELAISRQADVSVSVQSQSQHAWLKIVTAMDEDARLAYADAVEEKLKRRGKRRAPSEK